MPAFLLLTSVLWAPALHALGGRLLFLPCPGVLLASPATLNLLHIPQILGIMPTNYKNSPDRQDGL